MQRYYKRLKSAICKKCPEKAEWHCPNKAKCKDKQKDDTGYHSPSDISTQAKKQPIVDSADDPDTEWYIRQVRHNLWKYEY
jgi:hypothetical protein